MNKSIFLLLLLLATTGAFAQYKGVAFDYEKAVFGENQPLPAETHLMIQGNVSENVGIIELDVIEPRGRDNRLPLYTATWKRSKENNSTRFLLPMNYRLKGSAEYDIYIKYFRAIDATELKTLQTTIQKQLHTYLQQVIVVNKNTINLNKSHREIIRHLDGIIYRQLKNYRNRLNMPFDGFSELVEDKLKQISKTSLKKGKLLFGKEEKDDAKASYRDQLLEEFRTMIDLEWEQYMNMDWFKLADNKYIDNYSTEKSKRTLAIQAGFGGVYLDGNSNGVSLGAAPFVGFAFPLSKRSGKSKFLNNLAINAGVFVLDLEGVNGSKISGPIFKRPTYVGLSYKVFRFININAGATFLEDAATAGQLGGNLGNRIYIRPYIGISAQIDLWADFSK
jgi:hypothetical protein